MLNNLLGQIKLSVEDRLSEMPNLLQRRFSSLEVNSQRLLDMEITSRDSQVPTMISRLIEKMRQKLRNSRSRKEIKFWFLNLFELLEEALVQRISSLQEYRPSFIQRLLLIVRAMKPLRISHQRSKHQILPLRMLKDTLDIEKDLRIQ